MKVENLNGYANQFLITNGLNKSFQSYNSLIAEYKYYDHEDDQTINLTLYGYMWDYSATTRRHFKSFINEHTPFTYVNKAQWLKEIENNNNIEVI